MEDPANFYSKEDEWAIPQGGGNAPATTTSSGTATTSPSGGNVDPTYLLISLPGETEEEFLLTRPFTPRARNNMISLMLARSDPENYGELRLLQFPRQVTVLGPTQIDNLINQDVEISQTLTLLQQEGSRVEFGSLLTLPIEDSLMYVMPLFITADNAGIPELKRVVVVFGEEVAMEETFDDALAEVFKLDEGPGVSGPVEPTPGEEEPQEPDEGPSLDPELVRTLQEAADLYERAQDALSRGDFEAYGRLIEQLGELLQQAEP
jgi:hypothetical protein